MKINCLSCGHKVDLDDVYDNFEGKVKCFACGAMLEIKTEGARLKAVNLADGLPHVSPEETLPAARP
jgi:ribosomal protein S27E